MKILLRMGVISKANESLPATSRLSDGSKYLFIPDVIDSLLFASLTTTPSTSSRGDEEVAKRRLQSNDVIQLMRSHAENIYESVLDSCTVVTRVCDSVGSDVIRCVNVITSQLAVLLGILGLTKPCEITVSVICKQAVSPGNYRHTDVSNLDTIDPSVAWQGVAAHIIRGRWCCSKQWIAVETSSDDDVSAAVVACDVRPHL